MVSILTELPGHTARNDQKDPGNCPYFRQMNRLKIPSSTEVIKLNIISHFYRSCSSYTEASGAKQTITQVNMILSQVVIFIGNDDDDDISKGFLIRGVR